MNEITKKAWKTYMKAGILAFLYNNSRGLHLIPFVGERIAVHVQAELMNYIYKFVMKRASEDPDFQELQKQAHKIMGGENEYGSYTERTIH